MGEGTRWQFNWAQEASESGAGLDLAQRRGSGCVKGRDSAWIRKTVSLGFREYHSVAEIRINKDSVLVFPPANGISEICLSGTSWDPGRSREIALRTVRCPRPALLSF